MLEFKNNSLENVLKNLDISATMFNNATEKYKNISSYLESKGIEADFYPQGSFRLGTVVRPYNKNGDKDYDLDVICCLNKEKSKTNPKEVKNLVGDALKDNKIYNEILENEYDKCWTLEYAETYGGIGFKLDIVPSVEEARSVLDLASLDFRDPKTNYSISITHREKENLYKWCTNNPKGYAIWFDEINKEFIPFIDIEYKRSVFTENREIYNSIEDIPDISLRTSLQRTIQLLKRHRDIYFSRIDRFDDRPISAIITTLVARIAKTASFNANILELLQLVVLELKTYSYLLKKEIYEEDNLINKKDGVWIIKNPVDYNDNYADGWNNEIAQLFFKWIISIEKMLLGEVTEKRFVENMELSLGESSIKGLFTELIKSDSYKIKEVKPWYEVKRK